MSVKLNSALGGSVTLQEPNTASAFTLTLPTDNIQPGMNLITPTSVVGGTFSGGTISFSAATSVSINECFNNNYDNYTVIVNIATASASDLLNFRYRVSGTDSSTGYYYAGNTINWDASLSSQTLNGGNQNVATYCTSGLNTSSILQIQGPKIANRTSYAFQTLNSGVPGNSRIGMGIHTISTAYDGMTFIPASGNVTGTVRVYGLRNQ